MTLHPKNAPLTERQAAILDQIAENGYVTIEALAALFRVSSQTVRRDIIALSQEGRVQRFHGGAGPVDADEAARLDYGAKRQIGRPQKARLARKAAELVPAGATIYLDVGTTIEACALALAERPGFSVFTNSMRAAMAFDPREHQVYVLGGRMAGKDGSLVGEDIIQRLSEMQLDAALIACSAIDPSGRVMDFDLSKIAVKRAAMAATNRSLLLATASKFGRTALGTICHTDRFSAIVTEHETVENAVG